jgi:putative Ca2+/H+ antiporter (TMEM165/GDT1 family)
VDSLETLLVSAGLVALAEIGDKTQLLAIILAAEFRRPLPIILGILAATILNHATAATLGYFISAWLTGRLFQTIVGVSFILMAGWALIPDRAGEEGGENDKHRYSVFLTTLVTFFLVEVGDKTQIATSLLGARFQNIALLTAGTTLGMMLANVPAVLLVEGVTRIIPLNYVRIGAAVVFTLIGVWVLLTIGG